MSDRIPSFTEVLSVSRSLGRNSEAPHLWQGKVGHYHMFSQGGGTQLFDVSGYDHHGALENMEPASDWVSSSRGYALDFDGTNERVKIPDSPALSFGNGTTDSPFSVSAWVNMDDATRFRMASKGDNTTTGNAAVVEWQLTSTGGDDLALTLYDNASNQQIRKISTAAITGDQGSWAQYLGTYDGSGVHTGIKIYRNGVEMAGTSSEVGTYVAMHNKAGSVYIGAFAPNDGAPTFANGRIGDVGIWNRVLSASEIALLYAVPNVPLRLRRRVFAATQFARPKVYGSLADGRVGLVA